MRECLITRKELLDEAKPHWITALVGLAVSAASTYAQQRSQAASKRNQRNAAALNDLSQGGGTASGFTPTAMSSKPSSGGDIGSMGLKDLLSSGQPEQQNFNLGKADFSPAGQAPAAGATDKDFHLFGGNELDASKQPQQPPPQQQQQPLDNSGFGSTNDYIGLAQSAGQIASGLAQGPPPPPGFMPSPGPMNFQPTALQMLLARQRRGM